MIKATNTMDEMSRNIFYEKKAALKKGDDSVVHQIGEGRDIMSILSELFSCRDILLLQVSVTHLNSSAIKSQRRRKRSYA